MFDVGTVIRISKPAYGKGVIRGILEDMTTYLVEVHIEDFSTTAWRSIEVWNFNQRKAPRHSKDFQSRTRLILAIPESMMNLATTLEEPSPVREEILKPKVLLNSKVQSLRNPDKIYLIEKVDGDRVYIRDINLPQQAWWTTITSIKRNFTVFDN